ncbi:hypothetical protein [Leptospira idonii]|uniref:Carboxypeptidase regulatory-like domain-containing protein n=1 Tax=Leptospira idonii TaxID=1193500 RepID=A0A4R9LX90_9LEPT|nr:hypothetical protein [Leptospira idonii]TGN18880.1 hypothetical protein EHS15_10690 [Leptospira idonii]
MHRFIVFSFFLLLCLASDSYAEEVSIFGTIKNGTHGGSGKADSIRLIALQGAMLPLTEIGAQNGSFRFPPVEAPEGAPLLVQVVYKGVNYNKIIPPVPKFRTSPQEVIVFETGDSWKDMGVKSFMQVMREKEGLRIYKLFLLENTSKPPRSFFSSEKQMEYFVPKEAKEVFAQLQQPESKMAIPLSTPEGKNGGKYLDRAVLPGVSQLQISYFIPNSVEVLEEKLLLEGEAGAFPVFLKPKDMKMELLSGGTISELHNNIPPEISAYSIVSDTEPKIIKLKFIGGKPLPTVRNTNPEISNGTILETWEKSLAAVFVFLAVFMCLYFYLDYKFQAKD